MSIRPITQAVSLALLATSSFCSFADNVEVITITSPKSELANDKDMAIGSSIQPDLASWLQSVPGANVNRNGPVTGIAQYRGLFGDRVAVAVDGHTIIGAGPNAMDAPMSYVTPLIVESMSLYRGITPVSAGIDTLGGSININMRKAQVHNNSKTVFQGAMLAGHRQQNNANTLASWVNVAKDDQALMVFVNSQQGDSYEDGEGRTVSPTEFDKQQAGVDYRFASGDSEFGVSYHHSNTENSGTPALAMDINYIKGKRFNIDGKFIVNDWQVDWLIGYLDAKHAMDNFSQRSNMMDTMFRHNYATADSTDFKLHFNQTDADAVWSFGIDGYLANHDSTITNPNNMMFNVVNFNGVKDNRIGVFAQWQTSTGDTTYSVGGRLKHNSADANEVSHHMAATNMMMANLVNGINNSDRSVTDTNADFALNIQHTLSAQTDLYAGFGIKQRAPSYQERYLWMPMEATGGLADGKTYVGNINLDAETAYQFDLGVNFKTDKLYVSPHVYYQRIDDYIQGTPSDNQAVKMVANMMMGDTSPLQFANLDAEIYGFDVRWYYQLNSNWQLSGLAGYVRGKRRDISDDLYRIAPLNAQLALSYQANNYKSQLELKAYAKQDKVSDTNFEQKTAGYGLLNWSMDYYFANDLTLRGGIDNITDRLWRSHLSGYNRVAMSDITPMSRLPGEGRNVYIEMDYQF